MASKDRILRLKEENRCNILEAALHIAKEEGWQSLSMRKIADKIEYTAPIIYEYFNSKDAILKQLATQGFLMLSKDVSEARNRFAEPEARLEAMWIAYWEFAFREPELYQLMFGVQVGCCTMEGTYPENYQDPKKLIMDVIAGLVKAAGKSEDEICKKYYTFWSVIHGLVSINFVRNEISDEMNREVLRDAVRGIILSITNGSTVNDASTVTNGSTAPA